MKIGMITSMTITALDDSGNPIVINMDGDWSGATMNIETTTEDTGVYLTNVNRSVTLSVPEFSGNININMDNKAKGMFKRLVYGS